MNETMKFALQSLDEKLSSQQEIMERKLKYQIEGFTKSVEIKIQQQADVSKG